MIEENIGIEFEERGGGCHEVTLRFLIPAHEYDVNIWD